MPQNETFELNVEQEPEIAPAIVKSDRRDFIDVISHLQLAEERLKRYREDPSQAHDAFQVPDHLADKLK